MYPSEFAVSGLFRVSVSPEGSWIDFKMTELLSIPPLSILVNINWYSISNKLLSLLSTCIVLSLALIDLKSLRINPAGTTN